MGSRVRTARLSMRFYTLCALLIGAVAAQPFFPAGREYEFNYQGKIMSGIPKLDSHFAGLTMSSRVILQALDQQTYKLALKNVRFSKFNERLSGSQEAENWRFLETPQPQQASSEYQGILEIPVEFSMVGGHIKEVKVSEQEHAWTLNFKKSLISILKIQSPEGRYTLSQNSVRPQTGDLPEIWTVMEQGVDGECENTYQYTQLPEYMLSEVTFGKVSMEKCEGKNVYQITKTRNVDKCTRRTSWVNAVPSQMNCKVGNCETMWARTSMTRYIGCGSTPENMRLEVVLNEGEVQQNLMGYNTENVVTGTEQSLELIEERSTLSSLPEISSPRTTENLYYNYPLVKSNIGVDTKNSLFMDDALINKISPSTLQKKFVERIEQIVRDLKETEQFEQKQVSSYVGSLAHACKIFNKEHMRSVYEEVQQLPLDEEDKEIAGQLVLEIAVISGSQSSIEFLKEMIESEEFSPLRIGEILVTIPHYITTPTPVTVERIFELIKSPQVTRHSLLKTNAELAFATILNRVCVDPQRYNRYPIFVFGELCSTQKLTGEYIPYFTRQLEAARLTTEKQSLIMTLGEIGHESVIPILLPYLEGTASNVSPLEQRMALYSLYPVARQQRHILYPVYSALVYNPTEPREVRIAALSMLLRMQPSMVEFQKLATSTWFEQDIEFHKFVFSTLKSLSNIEISELPESELYNELTTKARTVFNLAKPVPGVISSTMNGFTSAWLKDLQVGYQTHGAYSFTGKHMTVYAKLEYFLQKLRFTPVELAVTGQGPRSLMEKITELFGVQENPLNKLHPEWKNIISSIDLKSREEVPFNFGSWMKLMDDAQVVTGLDNYHLEEIVRSVKSSLSRPEELREKICGKNRFNFVKVNRPASDMIYVPSEMGIPVIIGYQMPAVYAMRGEVEIDCSLTRPKFSLDVAKKASVLSRGEVMIPFETELIGVGVSQEWTVNYPTKVSAEVEDGKLKVDYTPSQELRPNTNEVDIFTYNVKPFAVTKPFTFIDMVPVNAHENTKILRSSAERKIENFHFGQELGIDMKMHMNTETEIRDMKSMLDHLALYHYNPVNVALFSWTSTAMRMDGRPSCRYHEVKVVYNPEQSTTKKVEIELGLTAYRQAKQEPLKKLVVKSNSVSGLKIDLDNVHSQEHKKVEEKIKSLNIEEGYGLSTSVELKFEGGERKSYNWELTACHGSAGVEQKWNLHLEDKERMNICVDGKLAFPIIPLQEIKSLESEELKFSYKNTIGFGRTCQEHEIKVTGTTSSSEEQKERSKLSKNAGKCELAVTKVEEIKEELRGVQEESSEYRQLEHELVRYSEEKNEYCRRQIQELSTLDKVELRIESSPMPSYVRGYSRILDSAVKMGLMPFMSRVSQGNNNQNEVEVELMFNAEQNTIDMVLTTEQETIDYSNIRLPEQLRGIVPLTSTVRPEEKIISTLFGSGAWEKCIVADEVVKTFDNQTYRYELDDCFHILSSDCSKTHAHAILGKVVDGKKEVEVFVEGSKVILKPTSSWSESNKECEALVDGELVPIRRNEKKEVTSRDGKVSYRIHRSADDVIVLETPFNRITFNGKAVELEHSRNIVNECGLCGNNDGLKSNEMKTAQSCIAKSAKQAALSYRIEKSCSPLSAHKQAIKSQKVICTENVKKASYSSISAQQLSKCQQTKHTMIRQAGKLCISQIPIVECGTGCTSRSTITRSVPFTCLPSNRERVIRLYAEKVKRGEILPELRNMEKSFSTEMEVPVSCSSPAL